MANRVEETRPNVPRVAELRAEMDALRAELEEAWAEVLDLHCFFEEVETYLQAC